MTTTATTSPAIVETVVAVANTLTWPGAFAIVGCAIAAAVVAVVFIFVALR